MTPAEFLRGEIEYRGWTQREFAKRLGRSEPFVSRVLNGIYPVGPAFALDVEKATGIRAEVLCRLQAEHSLVKAREQRRARR